MNKNYHLPVPLPPPVAAYYQASDLYDSALLASCFAEDAVLHDEGKEYRGPAAISKYILQANQEAKVSMDITHWADQNNGVVVTATLTGEFEGSPVALDFHFSLEDGKIKTLNITLTGD